jgi:hypothetical protein
LLEEEKIMEILGKTGKTGAPRKLYFPVRNN